MQNHIQQPDSFVNFSKMESPFQESLLKQDICSDSIPYNDTISLICEGSLHLTADYCPSGRSMFVKVI